MCCALLQFFSFDREYAWLPHTSVFKIHNFSLTKMHFPRPNNHKISDKVKAFPFLPPVHLPSLTKIGRPAQLNSTKVELYGLDIELFLPATYRHESSWFDHHLWNEESCLGDICTWTAVHHLHGSIKVKYMYNFRPHTITHRGSMQRFLRNWRNGIICMHLGLVVHCHFL